MSKSFYKKAGIVKRKLQFCAVVVFTLWLASTAGAVPLAEVNSAPIQDKEVNVHVETYLRQIGHHQLSPSRMAALRKEILKKLIEEELLYQDGLERNLTVTEKEVADGVLKIQNRFDTVEAFDAALSEQTLDLEDVQKGVERAILIQKSWAFFLEMPEPERKHRLKEMAKKADIQIYEERLRVVADGR